MTETTTAADLRKGDHLIANLDEFYDAPSDATVSRVEVSKDGLMVGVWIKSTTKCGIPAGKGRWLVQFSAASLAQVTR